LRKRGWIDNSDTTVFSLIYKRIFDSIIAKNAVIADYV